MSANPVHSAEPCPQCGYDRTGLAALHACPECGLAPDWDAQRIVVESWYATGNGATAHAAPFAATALLSSPAVRKLARRRVMRAVVLPLGLFALTCYVLASISATITFERWWESTEAPGVHRDPDWIAGRYSALGRRMDDIRPFLPRLNFDSRVFRSRPVQYNFDFAPAFPGVEDLVRPAFFCLIVGGAYFAATSAMRVELMRFRRQTGVKRTKLAAGVVLAWFGRPLLTGLALSLLDVLLTSAADLWLLDPSVRSAGLFIHCAAILAFVSLGWSVITRTGAATNAPIIHAAVWLLLTPMFTIILSGIGFVVMLFTVSLWP